MFHGIYYFLFFQFSFFICIKNKNLSESQNWARSEKWEFFSIFYDFHQSQFVYTYTKFIVSLNKKKPPDDSILKKLLVG